MLVTVKLQEEEFRAIMYQSAPPGVDSSFYELLFRLRNQTNPEKEELYLSIDDLQQIQNYALESSYGNTEHELLKFFERVAEEHGNIWLVSIPPISYLTV